MHYSRPHKGAVLLIVLIFTCIAFVIVSIFISGQYMIAKPTFVFPADYQALLNARSGIWKSLEQLNENSIVDSNAVINALMPLSAKNKASCSTQDSTDVPIQTIQPYSSDSFGGCTISYAYTGCHEIITSQGQFRKFQRQVVAQIGGKVLLSGDTVCYLEQGMPLQGTVDGKVYIGQPDTTIKIRESEITSMIAIILKKFSRENSGMVSVIPMTIQSNYGLSIIPDFVNGSLIIDGSMENISCKQKRTIYVTGDLQITGTTSINNMNFFVMGEIKIFDHAAMQNVALFSAKRITITHYTVFNGTMVSLSDIVVGGHAIVQNKSILAVLHGGHTPADSSTLKAQPSFSICLSDAATVDAVVLSQKEPYSIEIGKNTTLRGVVWAKGSVSLDGTVWGVIRAKNLVSVKQEHSGQQAIQPISVLSGAIHRIDNITSYSFPYFMGTHSIVNWQED